MVRRKKGKNMQVMSPVLCQYPWVQYTNMNFKKIVLLGLKVLSLGSGSGGWSDLYIDKFSAGLRWISNYIRALQSRLGCTDKEENDAKSLWLTASSPPIGLNICAFPHIFESPNIWLCNRSILLNFLVYEENFVCFFISVMEGRYLFLEYDCTCKNRKLSFLKLGGFALYEDGFQTLNIFDKGLLQISAKYLFFKGFFYWI